MLASSPTAREIQAPLRNNHTSIHATRKQRIEHCTSVGFQTALQVLLVLALALLLAWRPGKRLYPL
jgi:hypothetical protein